MSGSASAPTTTEEVVVIALSATALVLMVALCICVWWCMRGRLSRPVALDIALHPLSKQEKPSAAAPALDAKQQPPHSAGDVSSGEVHLHNPLSMFGNTATGLRRGSTRPKRPVNEEELARSARSLIEVKQPSEDSGASALGKEAAANEGGTPPAAQQPLGASASTSKETASGDGAMSANGSNKASVMAAAPSTSSSSSSSTGSAKEQPLFTVSGQAGSSPAALLEDAAKPPSSVRQSRPPAVSTSAVPTITGHFGPVREWSASLPLNSNGLPPAFKDNDLSLPWRSNPLFSQKG